MNWVRPRRRRVMMDMTPMIDVVLQLIIFFMFTSQFAQTARSPIDLPEEQGDENPVTGPQTVTVDIDGSGQILVEGDVVSLDELVRLINVEIASVGEAAGVTVLLRADAEVPALHLNRVAERLSGLGLKGWRLGTIKPIGGGS
mgnify:CR=1 FL=1